MKKIVVYTYYIDEERFEQLNDLILERNIVNLETRNERELVFAISIQGTHNTRIAIAAKPGEVYYNRDNNCYRVWFYLPDRDGAIEAIGNYILDRISPEIKHHRSFIDRLRDETIKALNLLDSLSTD